MKKRIDYRKDKPLPYRVRLYHDGTESHHGYYPTLREAEVVASSHHWLDGVEPDPENYFGFVYIVTDKLTGMEYIGSKQMMFYGGQCKNTPNDMDNPKWDRDCWVESDWRSYCTSSKLLSPIIKERPNDFEMSVVSQHRSKLKLALAEVEMQEVHNVLTATLPNGRRKYYNQHIMGCEYSLLSPSEKRVSGITYNKFYQLWRENKDLMYEFWSPSPDEFIKHCENYGGDNGVKQIDLAKPFSPWNTTPC